MLTIKRHRNFEFFAIVYDEYYGEGHPDNEVKNLTGWTARAQIREKLGGTTRRDPVVVAELTVAIPVPGNGQIKISGTRAFTSALVNRPASEIEWDLVGTDATGNDHDLVPTSPVQIVTPPTEPEP